MASQQRCCQFVEKSGAIWVGSSGRVRDNATKDSFAEIESLGAGALALLDLPAAHYGGYYEGFANSALWPALHSRTDLIRVSQDDYQSYREVNALHGARADALSQAERHVLDPGLSFPRLGAEMRDLGVRNPLGFFLHTPWPSRRVIAGVPHHRELIEAMLAYDLIGFQTDDDCENFATYLRADLGLEVDGGIVTSRYGSSRLATFPIGSMSTDLRRRPSARRRIRTYRGSARACTVSASPSGRSRRLFQGSGQSYQRIRPLV